MHALSSPSMDLVALSLPLMDPSPGPRRATRSRRCSRSGEGEACLLLGREGSSHHGHRATRTRALVPPQRGSAGRDMRGREPTGEREGAPRERGTSMGLRRWESNGERTTDGGESERTNPNFVYIYQRWLLGGPRLGHLGLNLFTR
jgi:hypothetical protein